MKEVAVKPNKVNVKSTPIETEATVKPIEMKEESSAKPIEMKEEEVEVTSIIPETWFTVEFTDTLDEFIVQQVECIRQNKKFVSPGLDSFKKNIEELVTLKEMNMSLLIETKRPRQKVELAQLKKDYITTLSNLNQQIDKLDREQNYILTQLGEPAYLWRLLELITRKSPSFFSSIETLYKNALPKYTYADFNMPNSCKLIDAANDCIKVFGVYKTRCVSKLTQLRDAFDLNESELKLAIAEKTNELDIILKFMQAHPNEYAYGLFVEDEFADLFVETVEKLDTRMDVLSTFTGETASFVQEYLQKNKTILQYCQDMLSFCTTPTDEETQQLNKLIDESYGSSVAAKKTEDTRKTEDSLTSKIEENRNLRSTIDRCIAIMTTEQDKVQAWDLIRFATKNNPDNVKITKLIALSIDAPKFEKGSKKQKLLGHYSSANITRIMLNNYLWFDYYECRLDLIEQQTEMKQTIYQNYDRSKCEEAFTDLNICIGMENNTLLEIIRLKELSSRDKELSSRDRETLDTALDNLNKGMQTINRIKSVISQEPNPYKMHPEMPNQKPFQLYHHYVWKLLSYLQKPDIVKDVIQNYKILITSVKEKLGENLPMLSELSDLDFYINSFEDGKVKLKNTFSDIEEICTRISQTLKYGKSDDLTEDIRSIERIIDIMNQSVSDCVFGIAIEPTDFFKSIGLASAKLGLFESMFSKNLTERNLLSGDYSKFLLKIKELVTIFQNIIFFAKPLKKPTLDSAKGPGGRGGKTRKQKRNGKSRKSFGKSKR